MNKATKPAGCVEDSRIIHFENRVIWHIPPWTWQKIRIPHHTSSTNQALRFTHKHCPFLLETLRNLQKWLVAHQMSSHRTLLKVGLEPPKHRVVKLSSYWAWRMWVACQRELTCLLLAGFQHASTHRKGPIHQLVSLLWVRLLKTSGLHQDRTNSEHWRTHSTCSHWNLW